MSKAEPMATSALFYLTFQGFRAILHITMPITTSAKKALRQSVRRKIRNTIKKDAYKTAVKAVRRFVSKGKIEDAKKALARAYQAIDKAAKTRAIAKNKASRLKSRLTRFVSISHSVAPTQ